MAKGPAPQNVEPLSVDAASTILYQASAIGEVAVYVNSEGNFFMRELAAERVHLELVSLGVSSSIRDEKSDVSQRPDTCVYVAPHEFFTLGRGAEWLRDDVVTSGFVYSTEQVHTQWFRKSLPLVLSARGIVELNFQTYLLFRSALPTLVYNSGMPPGLDAAYADRPDNPLIRGLARSARDYDLSNDLWLERPIDLFFGGTSSPRRDEFLGRVGGFLSAFSTCIVCLRADRRYAVTDLRASSSAVNRYVARRSKIALNVHRDEIGYFEWHRVVMQWMWHRTLVVSEPCLTHPVLRPGIHYFEEELPRFPKLIEWLLKSRDGRLAAERVRNEAFATLAERNSMQQSALRLIEFLAGQTVLARSLQ